MKSYLTDEALIEKNPINLTAEELIRRAELNIFSTGLFDGTSNLAYENTKFGIAKKLIVQSELGYEPNICFISTPDQTITGNAYRWNQGSGYGGKYVWGDGTEPIIFPDLKPNSCGMIVVLFKKKPKVKEVLNQTVNLKHGDNTIDFKDYGEIEFKWDLDKGNHFIDLCKLTPADDEKDELFYPLLDQEYKIKHKQYTKLLTKYKDKKDNIYMGIIHSSTPEMKDKGPGMYIDLSEKLRSMTKEFKTPFGIENVLLEDNAREYFRFCQDANEFSIIRRLRAAEKIFGEHNIEVICNINHQGLLRHMNEQWLGAQYSLNDSLMPIALSNDSYIHLVIGRPNFSEEQIERNGWTKRAKDTGLKNVLLNANVMPHGGGYIRKDISTVKEVILFPNGERRFVCETPEQDNQLVLKTPNKGTNYRKKKVVRQSVKNGLCFKFAKFRPYTVLKV